MDKNGLEFGLYDYVITPSLALVGECYLNRLNRPDYWTGDPSTLDICCSFEGTPDMYFLQTEKAIPQNIHFARKTRMEAPFAHSLVPCPQFLSQVYQLANEAQRRKDQVPGHFIKIQVSTSHCYLEPPKPSKTLIITWMLPTWNRPEL